MASRPRDTLRKFFAVGKLPTQEHFSDLIDSTLNMSDEGFHKSAANGVEIATPAGHDSLLSFYREQDPNQRRSYLSFGENNESEQIQFRFGDAVYGADSSQARVPALTLDARIEAADRTGAGEPIVVQRVGINRKLPEEALDVDGVVRARGRVGLIDIEADDLAKLKADGNWHAVTKPLRGCQAFEVMAGVGILNTGKFALLHAVALNTFNPQAGYLRRLWERLFPASNIRQTCAHYGRRCDQLELKWDGGSGADAEYRLMIRTRCSYGQEVRIQCHLTQLWFDPFMKKCAVAAPGKG